MLEVGVGTGLLALPLSERGVRVDGIDLSAPMLDRAIAKSSACATVGFTVADATRLPFVDRAFGGAFIRHVLHLVPDWRQVLSEAVRVIRPGGTLVVSITDYTGLYQEIQERFLVEAGGLPLAVGLRPDDPASLQPGDDAARGGDPRAPRRPGVPDDDRGALPHGHRGRAIQLDVGGERRATAHGGTDASRRGSSGGSATSDVRSSRSSPPNGGRSTCRRTGPRLGRRMPIHGADRSRSIAPRSTTTARAGAARRGCGRRSTC